MKTHCAKHGYRRQAWRRNSRFYRNSQLNVALGFDLSHSPFKETDISQAVASFNALLNSHIVALSFLIESLESSLRSKTAKICIIVNLSWVD